MPAASTVSPVMPRTMASIVVASRRIRLGRGLRRLRSANLFARVALDDFIEFAPIKPNAPTFRTVVNLNALAFAHYQINFACWTKKPMPLAMLSTLAYSPCEPYGKRVKWRSLSH